MYVVNVLLIEEKNLQLNDAFPNKNSSNKLSMYVCMSKLSKFVFATAIQLQPKNKKVKEKRSYPHRPTVRQGTYTHFIKHLVQTN